MVDSRTYGRNANVEVEVYGECKYLASEETFENAKRVRYTIESWDIVSGDDAKEIEELTDESGIDDTHEYLVLHLANGETATFRNSYVDMFRIGWAE